MIPINNNFSKYNPWSQNHKNTTALFSNLGGFPTTKSQINQLYHFQAKRGMKKVVIGSTATLKTFVNAFVHMRTLGAAHNRIELVAKGQMELYTLKKTGLIIKLNKPKTWDTMSSNQRKGFFGEEIQKEINLAKAKIYGHYIEQTPSGIHPSSGKGLDNVKTEVIFLGPNSDQESIEVAVKTTGEEIKTTSRTLSENSLDKWAGKNKGVQQMKEKQGQYYEQTQLEQAKIVADMIQQRTEDVVIKTIEVAGIGFSNKIAKPNKQDLSNTDTREFYKTPAEMLQQIEKAFTDPEKSAFVQIEYGNDD